MNNNGYGALGEYQAGEYLKKKGYKILANNAVFSGCELDIVAIYSVNAQKKAIKEEYKKSEVKSKTALKCRLSALDDILVFVEVKTRRDDAFAEAREFVDARKCERIRATASLWLASNETEKQPRFDVIEIYAAEGMNTLCPEICHMEDAFQ